MSTRCWLLTCGLLIAGRLAAPCLGAEDLTPLEQLEQQGLLKEKGYFILPIETPLRTKMINLRPTMEELDQKAGVCNAIIGNENELQSFVESRLNLIAQINDTQQLMSQMNTRDPVQKGQRAQLQQDLVALDNTLRECNTELAIRQSRLVSQQRKAEAASEFNDARKVFLEKSGEIGQDYTKVKEAYVPILDDSAIKAYNEQTRANLKLGPSEALRKGINTILKYEQTYSPETARATTIKRSGKKGKKSIGKGSGLRSQPPGTYVPKGTAGKGPSDEPPPQPRRPSEEPQGFVPDR